MRRLGKDELTDEAKAQILKEALAAINATGATVLIDDMQQILSDLLADSGAEALIQVGIANDSRIVNLVNEHAVEWARARSAELVGMKYDQDGNLVENPNAEWRIDEATRELIRGDVGNALDNGWSNDRLATELENSYAFSADRSEMIARTETAFGDVQGNLIGWRDSGLVVGKEWITGAGCCDLCDELDGVVVGIDDDFPNDGGDAPPLHPNCRCDVKPVLADDSTSGD